MLPGLCSFCDTSGCRVKFASSNPRKNYASLLPHGWIWCAMRFKCHQVDAHPPPSRNGNTYLQRAMYIGQPTGLVFMALWVFNIRTIAVGGTLEAASNMQGQTTGTRANNPQF